MTIFTLFRASASDWEPSQFAGVFGCTDDRIWRKGDKRITLKSRPAKFHEDSGFAISFDDQDSWEDAEKMIQRFLAEFAAHLKALQDLNVTSELSIGLTIGSSDSFIGFIELSPDLIAKLNKFRIAVSIAAYPASD